MTQVFAAIKAGKAVLVADADTREGEVDVVFAAGHATESLMAWTVRHTSGYICVPMPADRADALGLPLMVAHNEDPRRTAYTVSVDAAAGITTGISAGDRAASCRVLADPATQPGDLIRPGHVLPLRAHAGGVFARPGHTEAAVDIVRLSGAGQVAVICEVVRDDGRMMRAHDARQFATAQGLEFCTIEELITWRRLHDPL
ncbi:MAG: 3,4-dihydroxy-2-butanone-4-phosphate synthase, partial [Cellulomonadaceae bacterium]|nr:3,4-dihydroxy-2-butanone-4-phosphate synthase [Cellulomonadaceae bacterium]